MFSTTRLRSRNQISNNMASAFRGPGCHEKVGSRMLFTGEWVVDFRKCDNFDWITGRLLPCGCNPKNSRRPNKSHAARPTIKLGPDGYDERCYNCLQIGRCNHPRGELACCDVPNCTAAWHACCVGVALLDLLPDPWHCPKCVGFGVGQNVKSKHDVTHNSLI